MARPSLQRLRRDEAGFTLMEVLVASTGLIVVLAALLGLSDTAMRIAPVDRERSIALREAQVGLQRMVRELRQTYGGPADPLLVTGTTAEGNVVLRGTPTRIRYDCAVASPAGPGLRRCVRTENGEQTTVIDRVANGSTPVFTPTTQADGRVSYVRAVIEVPARGELRDGPRYRIVLNDGFYVRNTNAGA